MRQEKVFSDVVKRVRWSDSGGEEVLMTQPSNDELADALEQLADGQVAPGAEEPAEPLDPTRPVFPPSAIGSGGAVQVDPPEIVTTEEPADQANDVVTDVPVDEIPPLTASPMSTFTHPRPPLYQTMKFRRTIIPILLTCGVLTLAFSSLKFVLGPDSIFSDLPIWLPITLFTAGIVLLFLAVLNMLAVKHAG
jgi:hypothetical protein